MTIEREPQLLPSKKMHLLNFKRKKSHGLFQYKNYTIKIAQEKKNIFDPYRYKSGKILLDFIFL